MKNKPHRIGSLLRVKHGKYKKQIGVVVSSNEKKTTLENPLNHKRFTVSTTNVKIT